MAAPADDDGWDWDTKRTPQLARIRGKVGPSRVTRDSILSALDVNPPSTHRMDTTVDPEVEVIFLDGRVCVTTVPSAGQLSHGSL